MYKVCKTDKSVQRQKEFQNTLLVMMEKQKYHDITITALCKEMNAPRKAFYRYFDTLEDVLNATIDEVLTESFLMLEIRPELTNYFEYWMQKKYLLDIFEKNGLSQMLVNRSYGRMFALENINDISQKEIRYAASLSALMTMLILWHHSGMKQTPAEMAEMVNSFFYIDSL